MNDPAAMWNHKYGVDDYVYGIEPNDFVAEVFADAAPGDVLCLADGEGRNGVWLAERGHRVTSVDLSTEGVAKAARLAQARSVELDAHVADLADYDFGTARWDHVVSIWAHTPPAVRTRIHRATASALKPGGTFVLEAYTPAQAPRDTGGPGVAKMTMTLTELQRDLVGLVIERGEEFDRDVQEGPGHTGLCSVVQVIARRPA